MIDLQQVIKHLVSESAMIDLRQVHQRLGSRRVSESVDQSMSDYLMRKQVSQ